MLKKLSNGQYLSAVYLVIDEIIECLAQEIYSRISSVRKVSIGPVEIASPAVAENRK